MWAHTKIFSELTKFSTNNQHPYFVGFQKSVQLQTHTLVTVEFSQIHAKYIHITHHNAIKMHINISMHHIYQRQYSKQALTHDRNNNHMSARINSDDTDGDPQDISPVRCAFSRQVFEKDTNTKAWLTNKLCHGNLSSSLFNNGTIRLTHLNIITISLKNLKLNYNHNDSSNAYGIYQM